MKRTLSLLAAGLAGAVVALLALSLAGGAFAQGPTGQPVGPTPGTGTYGAGQMGGQMGGRMGGRMGGSASSLVGMAADELEISQAELVAQLGTQGTIRDVLIAGDVDPEGFVERFVTSRAKRLEAAVAAGALTREEADARLATARSMAAARIAQPFTALGPGGQGMGQGAGQGAGFVDEDGDGVCDQMPAGGQARGPMGAGRGPRR